MTKPISPKALDRMLAPEARSRILWTAEAIGARIGTSADFVRGTLANAEGSPIKKIGTRYCVHEADLLAFFRT